MESYKIKNLTFTYPKREEPALSDINLSVSQGEFITICGKSGCGKTTLLRLLKSALAPFGDLSGNIFFKDKPLKDISAKEQATEIGFVLQNPDNQIVTDKVWHELAFGLESLGYSTPEIRARVSEMASFFGIEAWFHEKTTKLSGGQKQLLNLASVMVMQPSVLILDEPTSQLDPIAAQEFLKALEKINRELGTTVILSEHRLEDAFPISDRVIVMDKGRVIADAEPKKTGNILKNHDMYSALPTPMRIYGAIENDLQCPLTVREGRVWLENYSEKNQLNPIPEPDKNEHLCDTVIELKDIWFRYDKELPDVIKGLSARIHKGELFAIVGGNGTGKTTALSLISGLYTPYRGKILINGEKISEIKNLYNGILGVLPQNPQNLFVKKTVFLDLMDMLSDRKISKSEKEELIRTTSALCDIENLLESHPYDLSGGEQQRAALAKILLQSPEILLLDEPTKGIDAHFKQVFANILYNLKRNGVTIIMVSHDIEFCAEHADRCAMFFDGAITSSGSPRDFFTGNCFYTTSANRMARTILPNAVLAEDVILACGGKVKEKNFDVKPVSIKHKTETNKPKKISLKRIVCGCVFAILFIMTCILQISKVYEVNTIAIQFISIAELAICLSCLLPQKKLDIEAIEQSAFGTRSGRAENDIGNEQFPIKKNKRKLEKRTIAALLLILLAIPLTIFVGVVFLEDRKYYFISLLIILEAMIPFCMVFEKRKPKTKELIIISVICAIAVSGRAAFFMLPQFKPVTALIIIAGVAFGGEAGFLVGAITGFVSNFFFGQGPWTPWQMFAFGFIGLIAGILSKKAFLKKGKLSLCIFGAASSFLIYGGIMNTATVILYQPNPTVEMFISSCLMGVPFDLLHAASTAFFLWVISEPMIEKTERLKVKYGLIS